MTEVHVMLVNENNGTIVVQECKEYLSEIVHQCISTSIVYMGSVMVWKHTFSDSAIMEDICLSWNDMNNVSAM